MKMLKKSLIILAIFLLVITLLQSNIFAYDWMQQINNTAAAPGDSNVTTSVNNIAGAIITIARIVCVGVAITMLVVLAMKYMMSAPGDRATIKKHAVVYVVGAIVMFASSGILGIIQKFATNIK